MTMVEFNTAMTRLAVFASLMGFALFPNSAKAAVRPVTFQRDVLPILAKHCQDCHRPGQVAPMSFLTYQTTRSWAPQIKALVGDKKMPPVVGTPHYTVLTKGEGLTEAEIRTLVKWVDDGAPEGKARDAKPSSDQGRKK
jgi:hypothetical protein